MYSLSLHYLKISFLFKQKVLFLYKRNFFFPHVIQQNEIICEIFGELIYEAPTIAVKPILFLDGIFKHVLSYCTEDVAFKSKNV